VRFHLHRAIQLPEGLLIRAEAPRQGKDREVSEVTWRSRWSSVQTVWRTATWFGGP